METLLDFRRSVYSQCGEDGIIAEVMRRWHISNGWFCEFGAWDGKYGSNTYRLLKQGWRGVMIEGDPKRYARLAKTAVSFPGRLQVFNTYVEHNEGPHSLDSLLKETSIPPQFDVLSIDIDGFDYHVWRSLEGYRPKLVIIEIGSDTYPGEKFVFDGGQRLTSFSAMLELGRSKGYTLICHTGNMIFAADEWVRSLHLDDALLESPASLFIDEWVTPSRARTILRKLRNLSWQRVAAKLENSLYGR